MLNTALLTPRNFIVIGLISTIFSILASHIYNSTILKK